MSPLPETVPFFSQWETPDMTMEVLAEGAEVALRRDPLWQNSGAETPDEYAVWAANICGMACLKMILATRGEIVPTVELARRCTRYGGYVVNEGSIKGLIYAPFVKFLRHGGRSDDQCRDIGHSGDPGAVAVFHRFGQQLDPLARARAAGEGRPSGAGHRGVGQGVSAFTIRPAMPAPHRRTQCWRRSISTASSPIAALRLPFDFYQLRDFDDGQDEGGHPLWRAFGRT